MNQWKTIIALLLTLGVLAAGAMLPGVAAAVQDSAGANNSGSRAILPVTLELSAGEPEAQLLLGGLALVRDGSLYKVDESTAAMAEAEVLEAVKAGLQPYYYAELIPYNWTDYESSMTPYPAYGSADPETYGVLWVVSISWESYDHYLELYVDDETGLILYLHYGCTEEQETVYTTSGLLAALSEAYFESTGLTEVLADPERFGVENVIYDDSGLSAGGDPSVVYTLYTQSYGQLALEFCLYQVGFYVVIR